MIKRKDIETLMKLREEKKRIEEEEKALTKKLILEAGEEKEKYWHGIGYTITEGKTTHANREMIKTLPDWEKYYSTTTYEKLNIKACSGNSK